MRSIRARLLVGLLGGMLLVLVAGAAIIFVAIDDEVDELFDYQLEQTAYQFAGQAAGTAPIPQQRKKDDPEAGFVVQSWDAEGHLLFQSGDAVAVPPATKRGWSSVQGGGESWRLYSADIGGRRVQVAQPLQVRRTVAGEISMHALLMFAPLFPLAALLIWFTVGRGLRPLLRLAAEVRRRTHRDLGPVDSAALPREIEPLAASLNDLMARLDQVITAQQTFVADAAHELLTPITALQLQWQLLSRAEDESARQQGLADLRAGLQRTAGLARRLLAAARQDAGLHELRTQRLDLADLLRRAVEAQRPLAEARSIHLALRAQAPLPIQGEPDALATLLDNLLDNAIKYTPAGGRVAVSLDAAARLLLVEDSGPGIPAQDHARVFDRFYRRPGGEAPGSGLGLAIVRDIAERHGASIELCASALGGLGVRLCFPAVT